MVSKRPHAANVAQTSETMSVVGNVLGILKKPMSALGKVRNKFQKKDHNKKQFQNMVFSTEKCQIYASFSTIIGQDTIDTIDTIDIHRRQTFQKELVGAVNKLRFQYRLDNGLIREGTNGPNVGLYLHIVDSSLMMAVKNTYCHVKPVIDNYG